MSEITIEDRRKLFSHLDEWLLHKKFIIKRQKKVTFIANSFTHKEEKNARIEMINFIAGGGFGFEQSEKLFGEYVSTKLSSIYIDDGRRKQLNARRQSRFYCVDPVRGMGYYEYLYPDGTGGLAGELLHIQQKLSSCSITREESNEVVGVPKYIAHNLKIFHTHPKWNYDIINIYRPPHWEELYKGKFHNTTFKKREWSQLKTPIRAFFCHLFPDTEELLIVLSWLSNSLLNKNNTYLYLTGTGGIGKTLLCEHILFGLHDKNYGKAPIGKLGSQFFSSRLENKTFFVLNEGFVGGLEKEDDLKSLSDDKIDVEHKFQDGHTVDNHANLAITCNRIDSIRLYDPALKRRLIVPKITDKRLMEGTTVSIKDILETDIMPSDSQSIRFTERDIQSLRDMYSGEDSNTLELAEFLITFRESELYKSRELNTGYINKEYEEEINVALCKPSEVGFLKEFYKDINLKISSNTIDKSTEGGYNYVLRMEDLRDLLLQYDSNPNLEKQRPQVGYRMAILSDLFGRFPKYFLMKYRKNSKKHYDLFLNEDFIDLYT